MILGLQCMTYIEYTWGSQTIEPKYMDQLIYYYEIGNIQ